MARENVFNKATCQVVNAVYGVLGLVTLTLLIILYMRRNHAGIASRHPFFSLFHCVLALLFFWVIIPSSCLINIPFLIYYLLRAFVIFAWFWASLCRYRLLHFDNEYFEAMKLGGMVTAFSIRKGVHGNGLINGILIGLYFIMCFVGIIVACSLLGAKFETVDFSVGKQESSILQIELIFTVMCIFPFAVIMFWVPHSIWDIKENWGIRDELVYIFMSTSILFFWDTAATAFNLFLELDTVLAIKLSLEGLMLAVTVFMCTIWVFWRTPSDKISKPPSQTVMAQLRDKETNDQIPLAYVLVTQYGYQAFLQHCVDEINVENLHFLSEICYFKKKFLERIEKLHMEKLQHLNRQSHRYNDDESLLGNAGGPLHHRFSIPDDRLREQHRRHIHSDRLVWSPCNSLTILTLKMKHRLEELPELRDDDDDDRYNNNRNGRNGRKKGKKKQTNLIAQWKKTKQEKAKRRKLQQINSTSNVNKIDIEDKLFKKPNNEMAMYNHISEQHNSVSDDMNGGIHLSADNRGNQSNQSITEIDDDIPLYVMAYALYLKFIKEGGDSEVNISSKTRTHLHYFFHPSNLLKDDETPSGDTPGGKTPGIGGLHSQSHTPRGNPRGGTRGGPFGGGGNTRGGGNGMDDEKDAGNDDLFIYEFLKDRENPNSSHSYTHLYKLYHIFDGAWAEIFHLIVSNVFPRFTSNHYFEEIKQKLQKDLSDETPFLKHLVSRECNEWFETVKPRSLIIIGVDRIPVDEQISYFGKPLERVNRAMI